jgi:hypothetical protein
MVIEVASELEVDEFINDEMHSNPSLQGMMCEYCRPFEIAFDEALQEDEHAKANRRVACAITAGGDAPPGRDALGV